ncbi:MAG TPA: hypothetical protein VFD57_02535 [Clostridia bacterium]|nr:hypothetical protein [Clostridia bacterium]
MDNTDNARKGKVKRMFSGGNTVKGFHSFFHHITGNDYKLRFIIKGGPGAGKSTFMGAIGEHAIDNGYDIVEHRCSTDPDSLDALFIPELKVALLDGTAPHAVEPRNPGITDDIIWLGEYWDEDKLLEFRDDIVKLNRRANKLFSIAFSRLKEGSIAYGEWRSYIQDGFSIGEYNRIVRRIIKEIFDDIPLNRNKHGETSQHFATAISCKGIYSYVENLIEPEFKVHALSGMPGSGVNEAIARIAMEAEELGLNTQLFHGPVIVDELEMLIIPELKRVIVDLSSLGNNNSLLFHSNQEVSYIDFDEYLDIETIHEFHDEIEQSKKRFYGLVEAATDFIARAKATHGQVEEYYVDAMDFQRANSKRMEVLQRIFET